MRWLIASLFAIGCGAPQRVERCRCSTLDPEVGALAAVLLHGGRVPARLTFGDRSCVLSVEEHDVVIEPAHHATVVARACGVRGVEAARLCPEMRDVDASAAPATYVLMPWGELPAGDTPVYYVELTFIGTAGFSADGYIIEQRGEAWGHVVRVVHGEQ